LNFQVGRHTGSVPPFPDYWLLTTGYFPAILRALNLKQRESLMADMLVPVSWEVLTQTLLPVWRAFVLTEDAKPLAQLINKALAQLPIKKEAQVRAGRAQGGADLRKWFALYALAGVCQSENIEIGSFLAHLVSPQGKRDHWGEEYSTRLVQLLRGYRPELSKKFANSLWPKSLEERASHAADSQLDELFAETLLFFATPRVEGPGDFSQDPNSGKQSAVYVELGGTLFHSRIAASDDGFYSVKNLHPALFAGNRRPPFSTERHEETETWGPLLPHETKELAEKVLHRSDVPIVVARVIQEAAAQEMGLFVWRDGF
jgi:hypothetical protein